MEDVKTDKGGLDLELSAKVARIFWMTRWRKENPDRDEAALNAAWSAQKEENRKLIRAFMRNLEKEGISVAAK